MSIRGIAAACALAVTAVGVAGCSSGGALSASATGKVPGDNGKLLPKISCWIQVESTSPGGDVSVLSVVNPNGGKVNCQSVISELNGSLDGYAAATTTPLPADEMDPTQVACSGLYYGDRVTVIVTYGAGSLDPGGAACQALEFSG
jgi:hypothetical protein